MDDLDAIVTKRAQMVPGLVRTDRVDGERSDGGACPRLPARFQLTELGLPVPVRGADEAGGGTGAGGGTATGPVTYDTEHPPHGAILVTTTLTPGLGPVLGRIAGLVSETGSVLSHLAILAREADVATVVGYAGARAELSEGSVVTVDGVSGQVTVGDRPSPSEGGIR